MQPLFSLQGLTIFGTTILRHQKFINLWLRQRPRRSLSSSRIPTTTITTKGLSCRRIGDMDTDMANTFIIALDENLHKNFVSNFDAFVFDCDGVIWMGNTPIPGAIEAINELRRLNKRVFFLTNNSTKTKSEFGKKFYDLGFGTTSKEEIISTSHLAATYLKERDFKKKAYVIGTPGVTNELNEVGIVTLPIGPDVVPNDLKSFLSEAILQTEIDPEVGAVVVGFDPHISYNKLLKAATYLSNPNCIFIATNTDERFPSVNENIVIPGTGTIVNAVETAANRKPIVMGKPSKIPFEYLKSMMPGLEPSRVLMIGDRANTDISFGRKCGMWTLLVLTGVSKVDDVKKYHEEGSLEEKTWVPNFYTDSIGDLLKFLNIDKITE